MADDSVDTKKMAKAIKKTFGKRVKTQLCLEKDPDNFIDIVREEIDTSERKMHKCQLICFWDIIPTLWRHTTIYKQSEKLRQHKRVFPEFHEEFVRLMELNK